MTVTRHSGVSLIICAGTPSLLIALGFFNLSNGFEALAMVGFMWAKVRMLCAAIIPGTTLFVMLCLLSLSPKKVPANAEHLHFGRREPNNYRTKGLLYGGNGTRLNHQIPGMELLLTSGNTIDVNSECKTKICAEYMSEEDVVRYEKCWKKTTHYNVTKILDGGCRFVDGRKREAVALASFPGSGNTWVRDLLEKVTGVCTGAYCCDISLRATGFTGEFIQSGSVLVVKTHRSTPMWKDTRDRAMFDSWDGDEAVFGAAIVIIRNPFNALVSEWNRIVANGFRRETVRLGTHTKKAEEWHFRTNRKWSEFLHREGYRWKEMVDNWVIQSKPRHPVLVVRYEDLESNVLVEMKRMLDFLQFPYSEEQLLRKLKVDYRSFKRQHSEDTFDPYTNYQRRLVGSIIHQTANLAKLKHFADILRLEDYLT